MAKEDHSQGEGGTGDLVAAAEAQVLRCGRRLAALIERLEAGELAAASEVPAAIAALDKALGAVFSERARRDRGAASGSDRGGDAGLDLGAARAEIRRRLDRLRAAQAAGGVPGGAE
jgi:hypothetical protein